MTAFAADTNVLVAAVQEWHDQHAVARAEVVRRLKANDRLIIAAHSLAECYAVLTRIPPPRRMAPTAAYELLATMYVGRATIAALSSTDYLAVLERSARIGVAGGAIYDATIGFAAVEAGVELLLTFNVRHFNRLGLPIEVREPVP